MPFDAELILKDLICNTVFYPMIVYLAVNFLCIHEYKITNNNSCCVKSFLEAFFHWTHKFFIAVLLNIDQIRWRVEILELKTRKIIARL